MKKADVLQLTIVLIGIVFGFVAVQYLLSSLYGVFAWIFTDGYGGDGLFGGVISIFALVGLQALCCWLLITKSDKLAAWFYRNSELGNGFKIISKPNELLHVLLIAIGIYLLLSNLSPLLTTIFDSFKQRSSHAPGTFEDERPTQWARLVLNITLPLLLLMFAKPIADYFAKNIGEEPISIEESFDGIDISETNEA
ncbi:MAG: hypothetical protein ABI685_07855 [Ferruginibacter sp.]